MESMQGGLGAGDGHPLPHHLLSRLPQPTLGPAPRRGGPAQHPGGSGGGQAESHQQRERAKDSHIHRGTHWAWSQAHMNSRFCCVASAEEPTHPSLSFPVKCSNASSSEAGGEEWRRGWTQKSLAYHGPVINSLLCPPITNVSCGFSDVPQFQCLLLKNELGQSEL